MQDADVYICVKIELVCFSKFDYRPFGLTQDLSQITGV